MKPILNVSDLEYRSHDQTMPPGRPAKFDGRMAPIGPRIGAQKLGYGMIIVPPGKAAFPLHNHHVNEEMFFILEGKGEVRIGDKRYPIREGDVIACPPGGPDTAHQIINTSDRDLRYLGVSTRQAPEVVDYPESKKLGVAYDSGPDPEGKPRMARFLTRAGESLGYWDGE